MEVDGGSIFVDFRKGEEGEEGMTYNQEEDPIVPPTPNNNNQDMQTFGNLAKEATQKHPLSRGTPLTIKKNKVARIQICEIQFNRTKASLQSVLQR